MRKILILGLKLFAIAALPGCAGVTNMGYGVRHRRSSRLSRRIRAQGGPCGRESFVETNRT